MIDTSNDTDEKIANRKIEIEYLLMQMQRIIESSQLFEVEQLQSVRLNLLEFLALLQSEGSLIKIALITED
jgi:hypothetical protein